MGGIKIIRPEWRNLADAKDSKSFELKTRAGSSPVFGIYIIEVSQYE